LRSFRRYVESIERDEVSLATAYAERRRLVNQGQADAQAGNVIAESLQQMLERRLDNSADGVLGHGWAWEILRVAEQGAQDIDFVGNPADLAAVQAELARDVVEIDVARAKLVDIAPLIRSGVGPAEIAAMAASFDAFMWPPGQAATLFWCNRRVRSASGKKTARRLGTANIAATGERSGL
jgi:hypothetical protein